MSTPLVLATTDGEAGQKRIIFFATPPKEMKVLDHVKGCHCGHCLLSGKVPVTCHCSRCHDHEEHPHCKCHCPFCHQCEDDQCGCHCDFCHKCATCTEDCQCFYCYEETGVCLECDEDCEFCRHGDHDFYCACDYCTRRMVSDGTFHLALMPSALKHRHESVYLHRPWPCSPVKHSPRMLYDKCTAKELRGFVRARGLADPYPGGLTLKHLYVRILEAADRLPPKPFHFLDLPPEIRTLIYEDLMDLDARDVHNKPAKIHTQILQTFQFVCKEGTDVLYSSSPVLCCIIATENPYLPEELIYRATRVRQHVKEAFLDEWLDYESLWPNFLKRVRHIRLAIVLNDWLLEEMDMAAFEDDDELEFTEGLRFVEKAVRQLATLLAGTKDLKKLEVSFEMDVVSEASVEDEDIQRALCPLRQLHKLKTFTLFGDVPDGLSNSIAQTVTSMD